MNYPAPQPLQVLGPVNYQLNNPYPVSQNYNNYYPQANPIIFMGPSNIYNYQSNIPQNYPNMPIPHSLEEQRINIPVQGATPAIHGRPKEKVDLALNKQDYINNSNYNIHLIHSFK